MKFTQEELLQISNPDATQNKLSWIPDNLEIDLNSFLIIKCRELAKLCLKQANDLQNQTITIKNQREEIYHLNKEIKVLEMENRIL